MMDKISFKDTVTSKHAENWIRAIAKKFKI